MKKIELSLRSLPKNLTNTCACIGYFDGVHLGHSALLKETIKLARSMNYESAVITFYPDPYEIVNQQKRKYLQDFANRFRCFEESGIEVLYILRFDEEMSCLSPLSFCQQILAKLCLKALICGFDFRYGYKGIGDVEMLRKQLPEDMSFVVVEEIKDEKGKISSSRIRSALQKGEIEEVNHCLGRYFSLLGQVIEGKKNGRKLGYPTANLHFSEKQLLPALGVYSARVRVNEKYYKAMVNHGKNPTFSDEGKTSLEIHILDFCQQIYGEKIEVFFVRKLRDEKRFSTIDELIKQLKSDELAVRKEEEYV